MRYKVKKISITPESKGNTLKKHSKCYLGVSINNPFFHDQHLGLLLKWISSHFSECIIIIGDYLHRINETILHGKTGDEAITAGIKLGTEVIDKVNIALSFLPPEKFKIYRWKQFLDQNPASYTEKKDLETSFEKDKAFHDSVCKSSTEFVDRLIERGNKLHATREEAILLSIEYLLEEMAVFSVLIDKGYKVQVYPGTQLKVLKELATGQFSSLKTNLFQGIYIDLAVKKIKK